MHIENDSSSWGEIGGNILLQTDLIAYINAHSVGGFNATFDPTDWVLNGDNYELTVPHNLGSSYTVVEVRDSNNVIFPNEVITINSNSVKLTVPSNPDLRFQGSIAINSS